MFDVATSDGTSRELHRPGRLTLAALLLVACSAMVSPLSASEVTLASPPTGELGSGPLEIQAVELFDGAPGMQLEVSTSGELVWTSYRDASGNLIVELPNSVPTATLADLSLTRGLVESAHLQVREEGEEPLTRLVVRTSAEAEHHVAADSGRLVVDLTPVAETEPMATDVEGAPEVAETDEAPVLLADQLDFEPTATPAVGGWETEEPANSPSASLGTADEPLVGDPPQGDSANHMYGVDVSSGGDETVVHVVGDGQFYYSTFSLQNPDRFVLDLNGVVNSASVTQVAVEDDRVERVRLAQFKPQPDLIARVVIDLRQPISPQIAMTDEGLALTFDAAAAAFGPATSYETADEPVVETAAFVDDEPAAAEVVAEQAWEEVPDDVWSDEPAAEMVEATPEPQPEPAYEMPEPEAQIAEVMPEPQVEESYEVPEPVAEMQIAEAMPEPEPEPWPEPQESSEPVMPAPAEEQASDMSLFEEQSAPATAAAPAFQAVTVGEVEQTFEGDPITMSLKDADIKDVLRSFAQLSGLNIVVQPEVAGTVTVELTEVPWDQALQQILKINSLDYELEGNIMRIAPVSQLRAEAEEQQRLRAAQALSIPLRTIVRRVSYAQAAQVAGVLAGGGNASIMSQRGSVVVDSRTNTLIIKELPNFIDAVIAIIEQLDIPEPQVMIEARIIETTKRFSRTLGVDWSFNGVSSAATGNTTGLNFPNNGEVNGGVQLLTGAQNGFLDISLGNVLNTFSLDAVLQAAETEGLINILSAPKITTLNNEQASIQSGLQIPIQTIANNTVSVQFVNATLRLDVTPHVTAEGTVLMDISIQKREPQLAFAVVGASNAPISTKDAKTRVIVRDGGTTVIGGIYQVSSDQGEDRVPGLASIPILGHLFKNKRRDDENEELLIFITPRVVKL
jgi:type IV pilus assembly protein PilQ